MCGRFSVSLPPEEVVRLFRIPGRLPNFPPRYNMAPTQDAPVIRFNAKEASASYGIAFGADLQFDVNLGRI